MSGLCAGAVALLLAGCFGDDRPPPPCPPVVRVPNATTLVQFTGEGRDLTDVEYQAELTDVLFTCEYDEDVIETDMKVTFLAGEGPAYRDQVEPLRYFVAIATADQRILTREVFQIDIQFQGNQRRLVFSEELASEIPLRPGQSGRDYRVFVGFELSEAQFEYNRDSR